MDPQEKPTQNGMQQVNSQQPENNMSTPPSSPQAPIMPTAEPPKNKSGLMIALIVVVLAMLGVLAFMMLNKNTPTTTNTSNSDSTNNTNTPDPNIYQKYNVTDKPSGTAFTVSFYKGAKVEEKNGRTYLNSGEAGSMYSVYLGVATGDKIDCGNAQTTTMNLAGGSTTVCYDSENTQYAGYAKAKNGLVKINLAGQKPISMEDAKTIMESVTF